MKQITPSEAICLGEYLTIEPIYQAREIYAESFAREDATSPNGRLWSTAVALAVLFNAGRVQGIREERAKRWKQA